jgi:hypothetical protein
VIDRSPFSLRRLLPWTIAVACALVAAWFGRLYVASNLEAEQLRLQSAFAELAVKSGDQQLEAERIVARAQLAQLDLANLNIVTLVTLQKNAADARAVIVWNSAAQEGIFVMEKMPALATNQRWELWIVEAGVAAKPVSAGVLDLRGGEPTRIQFKPTAPVGAVAKFVVSREKNDGAGSHTSPAEVILAGEIR